MAGFVGIDLGSHLVKGAVVQEATAPGEVIRLAPAGRSAGLPFVMQAGERIGADWEQYLRRRADFSVAFAFRDRVWEASSSFALGGRTLPAADMLGPVCTGVRKALSAALPGLGAVGLSVPDRWPAGAEWALPHAFEADGWHPALLARESVGALADWLHQHRAPALRRVLLLSLGAGSTWASLVTRSDSGEWRLDATACEEQLSGAALRERLIAEFARELVTRVRRDPTESAPDDQRLHDALEVLLHKLAGQPQCDLHAVLFGNPVTLPFSTSRLAELARPLNERLRGTVAEWHARFARGGPLDAVLCWGDLAGRLPVEPMLKQVFSTAEVHPLDPYCVARGVARLAALAQSGQLSLHAADRCGPFPLLAALPACEALGPHDRHAGARVVRLDGDRPHAMPVGDALRIGRRPSADWVLEQHLTQVSGAHAVVLRKGASYILSDLKSTNGTYLNGKLLSGPTPLDHGDTFTLAVDGPSFRFESS